MKVPNSFPIFEGELAKLGFDIKDNPKLISATLKAMAKTATTGILSSEYVQDMDINTSMQTDMVDEALGDYDDMMNSISDHVDKEYCEEDNKPTEA